MRGRGGQISTVKHKGNGLATSRKKNAGSNGVLTQTIFTKKNIKKMEDLSMRFIADLVHEKKQLVEKAEAILQEAEKSRWKFD